MVRIASLILALTLTGCGASRITPGATPQPSEQDAGSPGESMAPGHLVLAFRGGVVPADAGQIALSVGAQLTATMPRLGLATVQVSGDEDAAIAGLTANPAIASVLHDRFIKAHAVSVQPAPAISVGIPGASPTSDSYYNSPQGWAVRQAGGFGDNVPGGDSLGPWNTSFGAGVRIAILDSGVDQQHPDIAPNLALNLSEVNQSALPSPCDDGSAQDQQGHGTWVASLAAGALGQNTGNMVGVAPQAVLLNIKVLERMPAATGATQTAQCEAGEATGLLSWVLQGIDDAMTNHANVLSLSLGTLIDITTGDGAGWQAQFNAATGAAAQAGIVLVAAAGNDSLNFADSHLVELPAQARSVLAVVASTNPDCAEDLAPGATCAAGPVTRASYSNYGMPNAVAAPGGNYPEGPDMGVSGFVRGACSSGLTNTTDGLPANGQSFGCFGFGHAAYVQAIGTSASAPLVAGAAAILYAAHTSWTAAQIITALRDSATYSSGMVEPQINLAAALSMPNP